jgi:hypothetical protein
MADDNVATDINEGLLFIFMIVTVRGVWYIGRS